MNRLLLAAAVLLFIMTLNDEISTVSAFPPYSRILPMVQHRNNIPRKRKYVSQNSVVTTAFCQMIRNERKLRHPDIFSRNIHFKNGGHNSTCHKVEGGKNSR
jgi:hypothetical protein